MQLRRKLPLPRLLRRPPLVHCRSASTLLVLLAPFSLQLPFSKCVVETHSLFEVCSRSFFLNMDLLSISYTRLDFGFAILL